MADFDSHEALNQMEPFEQVKYYKKRLDDVSNEYFTLLDAIEKLKEDYALREYYQNKIFGMYDEVHSLRKSLSDLQIQTSQEKENVMKLTVENETLKTDFALCTRLTKLGVSGTKFNSLWAPTRPAVVELVMNNIKVYDAEEKTEVINELVKTIEELSMQVHKMRQKSEKLGDAYASEIACLRKERDTTQQEFERERNSLKKQIKIIQEREQKIESCNLSNLSEITLIKASSLAKELFWKKELGEALSHLRLCKNLMGDQFPCFPGSSCSAATAAMNVEDESMSTKKSQSEHNLKLQLSKKNKLISQYQKKCMDLQQENENLCNTKSKLKQQALIKMRKMVENIKFLKKHLDEQQQRRKLDQDGFHNQMHLLNAEVVRLRRQVRLLNEIRKLKD